MPMYILKVALYTCCFDVFTSYWFDYHPFVVEMLFNNCRKRFIATNTNISLLTFDTGKPIQTVGVGGAVRFLVVGTIG